MRNKNWIKAIVSIATKIYQTADSGEIVNQG